MGVGGGGGERVLTCSIHDFHTVSPSTCYILVMVNTGASFLHTVVVTSSCETESAGVAGAAAGPPAGRGERPGAVRRPWRATWGRPPAVESGLGPSAGRGERPGAVRRPWRVAWGRPPAVESGLGPSAGLGEKEKDPLDTKEFIILEEDPEMSQQSYRPCLLCLL